MREVAALAGVSLKTVSRVVNREGGVSSDVVSRVERAVAQLGYRPNLAASNLRRGHGKTAMVGALLQDVSNSFSASLLRSLEDAARDRDVVIVASSLDEEPERERVLVENLVRRRVDGLLLMPATARQEYLADDLRSGLPIMFVDRRPNGVDTDSVTIDNDLGARLAVNHLIAHGHRRIALLGDLTSIQTARARHDGYLSALLEAGIEPDPRLVATSLRSSEDAIDALGRLLDGREPPTAIFAARNSLAVGAIRTLHHRGLAGRIALVGFDDFPLADIVDPPLTVVRQNVGAIGAQVAARLFARIDGDTSAPRHVVIKPELIPRGSGEIRP
ncbi:LacI family DNA-binding transcriptional regulator [Pedococcus badiiscoriae]|uniref:LacI family DNA-binding transcriptional regulator n=1 Tax=Pedococcus badiiscoriae TaxID=642776 RepID=UPI0015C9A3E3|nr:LacI family DNA-binding transcriptional regulator [Pedococcus badiiscoriae]